MEQRVAALQDLNDGEMMVVTVDGKKTLLARVDGRFYATAARCPHWGGPLVDGLLHGRRLMCPWHMSVFDVAGGELLEPPALDGIRAFAVRVEGDDVYVDREAAPEGVATAPAMPAEGGDGRTFVVIGGGAAAAAAVEELRRRGFAGRLLLISEEDRWPYDRPNLSKDFLAGEVEAKWLPLRGPKFYEELQVERRVATVKELDTTSRTLTLDGGETIEADAVLVASGAHPRRLDLPGETLEGVFTLRSWDDAEALVESLAEARRVVIIGASFIGMEVAAAIADDHEVTVVGVEKIPFERALGAEVGAAVRQIHEAHGVKFALGRGVALFGGDKRVAGVELDTGDVLPADLVVVGVGVAPATSFIAGVETDRDGGLSVSDKLELAPGIYVAGDVARYPEPHADQEVRIEHWRLALQQGRQAARNMLGADEPLTAVPFFWTTHYDLTLGYAGAARGWQEVVIAGDLDRRDFVAYYAADDRLLAACGTRSPQLMAFIELMRLGRLPSASELRADPELDLEARLRELLS